MSLGRLQEAFLCLYFGSTGKMYITQVVEQTLSYRFVWKRFLLSRTVSEIWSTERPHVTRATSGGIFVSIFWFNMTNVYDMSCREDIKLKICLEKPKSPECQLSSV